MHCSANLTMAQLRGAAGFVRLVWLHKEKGLQRVLLWTRALHRQRCPVGPGTGPCSSPPRTSPHIKNKRK